MKIVSTFTILLGLLWLVACGPAGDSAAGDEFDVNDWDSVIEAAAGQTVNWYMWGGQDNINEWVTGYVADAVKEQYDVTLNMVPLTDTADAVNKVINEKAAGVTDEGTVDMIWINGENFFTMKQGDLLFGPWSEQTPNSQQYVNWDDGSVAFDLGLAVDGYEAPYGKAQFVLSYDSGNVPSAPTTIDGLVDWIKANPGKFAYPAPPDFTGYAFVLTMCYHAAGGHEQFLTDFDQAAFDEGFAPCWDLLNEIEPFLWREGETYPESHTRHDELYANGEVWFTMAWNPAEASAKVADGIFPDSTRGLVFDSGTPANTHYLTIPFNSPNKAGAMVIADFIMSPEAQLSKKDINNWGDFPAIDVNLTDATIQAAFEALPRGVATLTDAELASKRLPELSAEWRLAIEEAWEAEVLRK